MSGYGSLTYGTRVAPFGIAFNAEPAFGAYRALPVHMFASFIAHTATVALHAKTPQCVYTSVGQKTIGSPISTRRTHVVPHQ